MSAGHRVEGWVAIASACNRSIRWCQAAASRPELPMPVRVQGRVPWVYLAELEAWWEDSSEPYRARRARFTDDTHT